MTWPDLVFDRTNGLRVPRIDFGIDVDRRALKCCEKAVEVRKMYLEEEMKVCDASGRE